MLILSRVCVDFHDAHGQIVHSVTPANRNTFHNAPEAIQEDPIFDLLCRDGSLEAGITQARQRQMENDPTAGHDASGKLIPPEVQSEIEAVSEPEKPSDTAEAAGTVSAAPAASTTVSGSGKTARGKKADPAG